MKYIGGVQSYLHHTILMLNPTNIDKLSVQATHLEANKGKHVVEDVSGEPYKSKSKKTTTMKKMK
jgi:hypothetical protein